MSDDGITRARAVLAEATPGPFDPGSHGDVWLDGAVLASVYGYQSDETARAIVLSRNAFEALLDVLASNMDDGQCQHCGWSPDAVTDDHERGCLVGAAFAVLRAELERLGVP